MERIKVERTRGVEFRKSSAVDKSYPEFLSLLCAIPVPSVFILNSEICIRYIQSGKKDNGVTVHFTSFFAHGRHSELCS
jgi:hypothetical protein